MAKSGSAPSNRLLATLPREDHDRLAARIEDMIVGPGEVLYRVGGAVRHVYFPTSGILGPPYPREDSVPTHADRRSARSTGPPSVLVVDGHADAAWSLAELIRFWGYRVAIAATAHEALRSSEPPPDVVITELRLPDLDGCELVRRLRGRSAGAPRLVVAVTTSGREQDRRRSAAAGVDLHLVKPADTADLEAARSRLSSGSRVASGV